MCALQHQPRFRDYLHLPLIDRATDAPREKLQSLCAIWRERHGPHSQPKKLNTQNNNVKNAINF